MQENALTQPKIRLNVLFTLLILMFVIGMTYGVLLISGDSGLLESLRLFTGSYTVAQRGQSLLQSFLGAFCSGFFFLLVPYLLGYSSIGQPAALLVPLFKGLGLGAFLGNLYRSYGFQGLFYSLLIVIPYTLAGLLAIFIGCRESIRLSNLFFCGFLAKRETVPVTGNVIRLYNIKFLVLVVIVAASAIIYTVCVLLFARLFQF